MKKLIFISILGIYGMAYAQQPFHIMGNFQIHDQGALGFHTDLINDGMFDQNLGLVGFYNTDRSLTISGSNKPVFHDMRTAVSNDLILEVGVGVTHFKDFVSGRIITPRNDINTALELRNDAPYMGTNDAAHTDGYVANTGALTFTFPIGDDFRLRPMHVSAGASSATSTGAYFFEDPNNPSTFNESFNTTSFQPTLSTINPFEFWDLDGATPTQVTLTWDAISQITNIADDIANLRVVGWSAVEEKWINLGNTATNGNLTIGEITSDVILPNNYEALTIGSVLAAGETIFVYNAISPNDDGKNDVLIIRGIESVPDNELIIYNRWGQEVYRKKGYDNSWGGNSEGRVTPQNDKGLPVGTYYYILEINGQQNQGGYFYIQR